MPRLFTAIELPDDVRDQLARLSMPLPGARWIEREALHITLRFAGDVDNPTAAEFESALATIDVPAFEARLSGAGTFGGQSPRTLWAGIEAGPELDALARAHERAARAAGLAPEKRPFKAHVTLARLQNPRIEALARFLQHKSTLTGAPFLVDRFVLMSSRPKVGGGPYVVEASFPLETPWPQEATETGSPW